MGLFNKNKDKDKDKGNKLLSKTPKSFDDFPFLKKIKPKEFYVFRSDYYVIDDKRASTILTFMHIPGSNDGFPAFWGINLLPTIPDDETTVILLEQMRPRTKKWIESYQSRTEEIVDKTKAMSENTANSSNADKIKGGRKAIDMQEIAMELVDGASYLHTHFRLLVTAPIDRLDTVVDNINKQYEERFSTLSLAPYIGSQRDELSTLFSKNEFKEGKGFGFTSVELAGSYNLVTHGIEDSDGEYIGYMVGDVNSSAVLFNLDNFDHHIVIGNSNYTKMYTGKREYWSDIWGAKLSQSFILHNHRVVHLVLNNCDIQKIGLPLNGCTTKIDMNSGDVNMFEFFGSVEEELSLFPIQMQKLQLMFEQCCDIPDTDLTIVRGMLRDVLEKFYISSNMWIDNADKFREKVKLVNVPHNDVPMLEMFYLYLKQSADKESTSGSANAVLINAYNVLMTITKTMLSNNGDLFNKRSDAIIDDIRHSIRTIFDFSKLKARGAGVMMAQLVNVAGLALNVLDEGDVVIIHGCDSISKPTKVYLNTLFESFYARGGRVAFLYNKPESMIQDSVKQVDEKTNVVYSFGNIDKADYTIIGDMTMQVFDDYVKVIGLLIPQELKNLITTKSDLRQYIRRDFDNVVIEPDLLLGIGPFTKG